MKKLKKLSHFKKNKGFLLIELMAGLGIIAVITIQGVKMLDEYNKTRIARNVGDHIKQIGQAANKYVTEFYSEIYDFADQKSKDVATPVIANKLAHLFDNFNCDRNKHCEISIQELKNLGFLNSNTAYDRSPVGLEYKIVVNVADQINSTDPNVPPVPIINGLVVTKTPWLANNKRQINYALLGEATHQAGVDAGFSSINQNDFMRGYKSGWELRKAEFPAINQTGLLGYRFGFHSGDMLAFLRRDGSLPMTGDLKLGYHNLYFGFDSTHGGIRKEGDNLRLYHSLKPDGTPKSGILITPEEVLADHWLCAHNESNKKICMGGSEDENNGGNFEIKMSDSRPLLIHNTSTKPNGSTIEKNLDGSAKNGDKVVMRIGGSLGVHDNLYVGDIRHSLGNDPDDRQANLSKKELNDTLQKIGKDYGGNVFSNTNINYGNVVLKETATAEQLTGTINKYSEDNNPIAIEMGKDGRIIAKDIFFKDIGKSTNGFEGGNGLHISQITPAYSSRGAFVVEDGDIVQKPSCQWEEAGVAKGRKGLPKIILSAGNVHTSGDEVDQNSSAANNNVDGEKFLRKHRLLLKVDDINDENWAMVVKTRSFDGSRWVSAGQAVAHIYCQLY